MNDAIVHASPVVLAVAILTAGLEERGISCPVGSDPVSGDGPDAEYPPVWVTVTRAGGSRPNLIQGDGTVLVQVTGDDESTVEDLASLCEGILTAVEARWVAGWWVYRVDSRTGIVDVGDVARERERFQFLTTIRSRAAVQ